MINKISFGMLLALLSAGTSFGGVLVNGTIDSEEYWVNLMPPTDTPPSVPTSSVTLELTNEGESAVTYNFNSGCQAYVSVKTKGGVLVKSSEFERVCTMALTQFTLKPGESKVIESSILLSDMEGKMLAEGDYLVEIGLIGYSDIHVSFPIYFGYAH